LRCIFRAVAWELEGLGASVAQEDMEVLQDTPVLEDTEVLVD